MPSFAYTARDGSGAPLSGTLIAESVQQVTQMLRVDGKFPTSILSVADSGGAGASIKPSASGIRVSRADVIQIAQQLSIMVETGVTIADALDCIAQQAIKPNVKLLLADLSRTVQGGTDFSTALQKHPRSFPRLFIALIKASEKSGMLSKLLMRGTNYLRDEMEIIRRVKGALTYPSFMLAFAVSTTIFLLTFVLPKFTAIYASKAAALPVPTKILMAISDFLVAHYLVIGLSLVGLGVGGYFYIRTPGGRKSLDYLQLNVPLLGSMYRKLHLARSLRMVGTLASAGVNLIDCVNTARDLCGNSYFRKLWERVLDQIQVGKQLSDPLFDSPLVPRSIAQMISSGEKSGKLAFVLEQVAGFSEVELKEKITEMTRYIEPVMIMIMGLIIGGVALALLLPVFTISRVMAH